MIQLGEIQLITMNDYDAKIGIVSTNTNLVLRLTEKFTNKFLEVQVLDLNKKNNYSELNYLVVDLLDDQKPFSTVINIVKNLSCKIIVLHPLEVKQEEKYVAELNIQNLIESNNNLGVILVPELLGKDVTRKPNYVSHDLIYQSILSERVKTGLQNYLINTITLSKLVEVVVKETFSFGISGKKMALVGPRKNTKVFIRHYLGVENQNILFSNKEIDISEISYDVSYKVDFSLKFAVSNSKNIFSNEIQKKKSDITIKKIEIYRPKFKGLYKILIGFVFFVTLPFLMLFVSVGLLITSIKFSLSNSTQSRMLLDYSLKSTSFSNSLNLGIPMYYDLYNVVYKSTILFQEALNFSDVASELVSKIIGNSSYDLALYTDRISAILDRVYIDINFLQSDTNQPDSFVDNQINKLLTSRNLDINKIKNDIYSLKKFSSRLSTILGLERPMKYLILFQNNMELRPTGGFIGSFAIVTFDQGRMSEISVNDIYSADGQLKGHVDPPEPIRMYLGEGGWYMRDSNWDPDFSASALRAEWFLDKEVNTQVDGVIAIDLSFVEKILRITGPLNLVDYNKTISADNLYITTQEEVESNFFPGSIKKASFMSSLSKQLIFEMESLEKDKYFAFIKALVNSLEERHVQLYLHDLNAQESINSLGYSGEVNFEEKCGTRCIQDGYSLIDANLGVNKSNLFIERSQKLNLEMFSNKIGHQLYVKYDNKANSLIGNSGVYKSYTRLLVPLNAKVLNVTSVNWDGTSEEIAYDLSELKGRKEVGFLINLLPGTSKTVLIEWDLVSDSLKDGGEFIFNIRKQAGTDKDKLEVQIIERDLTLTGKHPSSYNTNLERDFKARFFLRPQSVSI